MAPTQPTLITYAGPPPSCTYGAPMKLRAGRAEFGSRPFWGCSTYPRCTTTHGAHADGTPLGVPADETTRRARQRAHAAFDALWQRGGMKRKAAYAWMRAAMGLSYEAGHIACFDVAQCERLIALVAQRTGGGAPPQESTDEV